MECPICASAELRHSPGEQQLGGLRVRPDTVTCPNCGAQAEQLSNDRLRFTRVPTPYSFPIGTSLDEPVLYSESRRIGEQARRWLELRATVEAGEPVPDSLSAFKRGETCFLHISDAVLSEERTREGRPYLARTDRGDLYFTDKHMYVVGDKVTRVPLEKIARITFARGRLGFRFMRLDRKRPQHITLNSQLDHHLVQLMFHRQSDAIPAPQLGDAHTLPPSSYKFDLRALGSIWRGGGIGRVAFIAVCSLLLAPCCLCIGSNVFAPKPSPTTTRIPTDTPTAIPIQVPSATLRPTRTPQSTETPQPTRTPTLTPIPTEQVGCTWRAAYLADVTVPDGTRFDARERFEKTWRVRNSGTCTWDGIELSFSGGDQMTATDSVPIKRTDSGEEIEISVAMRAPADDGSYSGIWSICYGDSCFYDLTVNIVVGAPVVVATRAPAPTAAPVVVPTATPVPAPAAVCDCSHDAYNCSDFSTHRAAQACFNYCIAQGRGDIHRLDRDNDGVVCESLP
jgi:hypothetical protein